VASECEWKEGMGKKLNPCPTRVDTLVGSGRLQLNLKSSIAIENDVPCAAVAPMTRGNNG